MNQLQTTTGTFLDTVLSDLFSDLSLFESRCYNIVNAMDSDFVSIGRSFPRFDVTVAEDKYEVVAAVPGYKKEDFELEVIEDDGHKLLSLKSDKQTDTKNRHIREIHRSSFHRSISLPGDADDKNITSELVDGLLTINIPRVKKQKQLISIK